MRSFLHPERGGTAMVLTAVFVLGLVAGAMIGPGLSGRMAAVGTVPPADAGAASTNRESPAPVRQLHPVQVVQIVDGDTFDARVNVSPGSRSTRGSGCAALTPPRCGRAARTNKAARRRRVMRSPRILAEGSVGFFGVTLDKYGGRVLAEASTRRTPDVSTALLQAGLVRRYAGGRRENWC